MYHTNPVSALRKQVNPLGLVLALGVALFAAPGSASPPPAASTVTVYNCLVTYPSPSHLHVTFATYNSDDIVRWVAYEHSSYLDSRTSSTASPSSATLHCATSDGCNLHGATEACGSAGTSAIACGDTAKTLNAVTGEIEFAREGFFLVFRRWEGRCR